MEKIIICAFCTERLKEMDDPCKCEKASFRVELSLQVATNMEIPLIHAAPDLLAALKCSLISLRECALALPRGHSIFADIAAAELAIAKAGGREE